MHPVAESRMWNAAFYFPVALRISSPATAQADQGIKWLHCCLWCSGAEAGDAFPQCPWARADYKRQGKLEAGLEKSVTEKELLCVTEASMGSVGISKCSPSRAPGNPAQHRSDAGGLRGTWVFQGGLNVPRHLEKQNSVQCCSRDQWKRDNQPQEINRQGGGQGEALVREVRTPFWCTQLEEEKFTEMRVVGRAG